MSDIQIYYFTKSGRSETIAKKLAEKHGIEAHKISDQQNWNGVFGFIKAGAKASKEESVKIDFTPLEDGKDIVLVFPVWASKFPPAINTFIEKIDRSKLILIPTSMKSTIKDHEGYKKVIDLVGKDINHEGINL